MTDLGLLCLPMSQKVDDRQVTDNLNVSPVMRKPGFVARNRPDLESVIFKTCMISTFILLLLESKCLVKKNPENFNKISFWV